ncbi:PREDICTED: uncharacterized protein LOC104699523 [Camelina sativa]|uniref:Uncharacterized protein LOC104699523 n=1 Tax=Camelina sativa TaxID=90675 RepID=A0ABM0SLT4_CAMSA|nr:PREDICTED: uncharacterized protein LOC104699523 [Camelina sativa]
MTIEDFVSQPRRELIPKLHPNYIGDATCNSINRMMYGLLKEPYETYSSMPRKSTNQGSNLWIRKCGKKTSYFFITIYDRDPELVRALQEKDDRIEALEKMMEKENEMNKLRDEELASFMVEMRLKFPVNSSS